MITDTLSQLIEFPTMTSDLQANLDCLLWCQEQLKNKGVKSTLVTFQNKPMLVWGAPLNKCEVMINSHVDVVPAAPELFRPSISGNILSGRGSADTKSFVSALLSMTEATIKTAIGKNISFSLATDEEVGGSSTREMITSLKDHLKFGVFGEPTNLTISNQAKGIMQIKILATGKPAHGSRPWDGTNAINLLAKRLTEFLKHNPTPTHETFSTTFGFSQINGGTAINQIPGTCELWVDVRLNPHDDPKSVVKILKKHFTRCKIEIVKSESPILTSPQSPFIQTFVSCLEKAKVTPKFTFNHASSDARHCTALGIDAIVFGPEGTNLHQVDEQVDIPSIKKCQQVLESFINSC